MIAKPLSELRIFGHEHLAVHTSPARIPVIRVNVLHKPELRMFTPGTLISEPVLVQVTFSDPEAGQILL